MKSKRAQFNTEQWFVIGTLSAYLIFSIIWHFLTNAPWDDDCVTRYYNARNGIHDPANLIDLWNRPLFMILFFIPLQLGKHAILLMAGITIMSVYALYQAAKELKIPNAYMVIPIVLFQAFFFTISRSALAEPLAAAIISFGCLFYARKNFLLFAITGSLIPLARLELSILLIIWAYVLLRNKQWKYILLLGVPCLLWNFAGTLIHGDIFWLYDQTIGKETSGNRYGHTTFGHYFQRFIYVTGPVVFYFFMIGFAEHIYKLKLNAFIFVQAALGFMVYVIFSWKLDLGQAAGFLRHLISISPLFAIIALYGYNYWLEGSQLFKPDIDGNTQIEADLKAQQGTLEDRINHIKAEAKKQHLKPRQIRHLLNEEKGKFDEEKGKKNRERKKEAVSNRFLTFRVLIYSFGLIAIAYLYFSKRMQFHHTFDNEADYKNVMVISSITLLYIAFLLIFRKRSISVGVRNAISMLLIFSVMSFTLITEPPNSHNSPERETMNRMAKTYLRSGLKEYPTYINHSWFFWSNGLEPDRKKFRILTKANLEKAPVNSIVIWENHYSNRLAGDVDVNYFVNNNNFIELVRQLSSDNRFMVVFFQKVDPNWPAPKVLQLYDEFIADEPEFSTAYVNRANYKFLNMKDFVAALVDYSKAIKLDSLSTDAHYNKGLTYFRLEDYVNAKTYFLNAAKIKPDYYQAHYNAAVTMGSLREYQDAVRSYSTVIKLKPDYYDAYNGRALAYTNIAMYPEAIEDYSKAIEMKKDHTIPLLNRGKLLMHTGNLPAGCTDLRKAAELGDKEATQLIQAYCK